MSFLFGSRSSKTFKPKKNIPEGSHQYELLKHAEATLGSGNLRMAVMLPEGEDLNEWVAVNTVDFFNQINMLYGTITDFCTEESCPVMSAGPKYEYHWADGTNIKKPIKCSAPKYIDYLMTWVQDQLDDETLFPSKIGNYIFFQVEIVHIKIIHMILPSQTSYNLCFLKKIRICSSINRQLFDYIVCF
ncbi:MOB kinase activator 1B isoform X2 [Leptonychotes weddellii]|uniref:MOB kinase activator 1B isoform X2 n=1 Tax=Leptonychotes weddellii TaxID=9713 RepID=A0A7F8QEC2_LEPWE|nr:MOB kinase activator 1B isoform X2 [Leptonychotes weddellii]